MWMAFCMAILKESFVNTSMPQIVKCGSGSLLSLSGASSPSVRTGRHPRWLATLHLSMLSASPSGAQSSRKC